MKPRTIAIVQTAAMTRADARNQQRVARMHRKREREKVVLVPKGGASK